MYFEVPLEHPAAVLKDMNSYHNLTKCRYLFQVQSQQNGCILNRSPDPLRAIAYRQKACVGLEKVK